MKKLKVYSQTGKPTDVEAALEYEKLFKAEYDKLWKLKEDKEINIDEFREKLGSFEIELRKKFPMYKTVPLPKSGKQWKEMIMEFEAPVTLAITQETEELALFIMDAQY